MKRINDFQNSEKEFDQAAGEQKTKQIKTQKAKRRQKYTTKNQRPHQWLETDDWTDDEWEAMH